MMNPLTLRLLWMYARVQRYGYLEVQPKQGATTAYLEPRYDEPGYRVIDIGFQTIASSDA